jgi:ppGpp synthetase/RelA/SpoT-type nucleotidyltranferase
MSEQELISRWGNERPIYYAWATFIQNELTKNLPEFSSLIKIPVSPRLKEDQSLIDKALYRKKSYDDPYVDITDKVGLRFVTLLTNDIKKIESVILASKSWMPSKDRDYEAERREKPLVFDYQSIHYVLRPTAKFEYEGILIEESVSCEVQIRTLLQHAHSELTHDNLYKPNFSAKPKSQRLAAKSMALIEVADDFFGMVVEASSDAYRNQSELLKRFCTLYGEKIKRPPDMAKVNQMVIDMVDGEKLLNEFEVIEKALLSKSFIFKNIADRYGARHVFRQPIVLLMYYLVMNQPVVTKTLGLIPDADLRTIYTDLGYSFDDH